MGAITKEMYDYLMTQVEKYNKETVGYNLVECGDIIHTYFYPSEYLNDFDEGESNDPYWNKGLNKHSVEVLIENTCQKLREMEMGLEKLNS